MYFLAIGGRVVGHLTAGEAWLHKNLESVKESSGITTLREFKEHLDAGEVLRFGAVRAYLKGEPVDEDVEFDGRTHMLARASAASVTLCDFYKFNFSDCLDEASITALFAVTDGVWDTRARVLLLSHFMGIRQSYRFPAAYSDGLCDADELHFFTQQLIKINRRKRNIQDVNDGEEIWRIECVVDHEGNRKETSDSLIGKEVYLVCVRPGMSMMLEFTDSEGYMLNSTTVLGAVGAEITLTVTTRNTVYVLKKIK